MSIELQFLSMDCDNRCRAVPRVNNTIGNQGTSVTHWLIAQSHSGRPRLDLSNYPLPQSDVSAADLIHADAGRHYQWLIPRFLLSEFTTRYPWIFRFMAATDQCINEPLPANPKPAPVSEGKGPGARSANSAIRRRKARASRAIRYKNNSDIRIFDGG